MGIRSSSYVKEWLKLRGRGSKDYLGVATENKQENQWKKPEKSVMHDVRYRLVAVEGTKTNLVQGRTSDEVV